MPVHDLALLVEAAREAGRIATRYVGRSLNVRDKADGSGPVTLADLAVNAMLAEHLRAARPAYGWLSEETEDDTTRLDRERVFIVDPIDGTRSFIEGSNTWAHSLAVAERGVIIAAVIYLPLRDKLYTAATGQGTQLNGAPIRAATRADLAGASLLAATPNFAPERWRDGHVPQVTRGFRPSLAYRLSLVAEGRYDAMLTLRPTWEWDIAAGDLILREAGAATSDRRAAPLRFNNPVPRLDGVVAANPVLHGALHRALTQD
ncbi:myo-inositol-1(or 4)-monophosphatase [Roseovarius azorensis]|uniref:Myo-inositol-1(Or 4)-monophosphatase n=1 Tax=Roseovarius azorensis TaxID=1287727 RepID=A0A1H7UTW3_9RHOB|nr:3'(2'),5'-bisphosphate nucleotidase CysQ [Roseovarius azorensis]SEM00125.1 myo-inositol-1(or 4)-monophosphatase [Roseovarius azorensis]